MEKYRLDNLDLSLIENSCVPVAVYQFVDKRVVTVALSEGFCELFGYDDICEAYDMMDHDMYRDTHHDDAARIAEAAFRFATKDEEYNVIYRTKAGDDYRVIHARGRHIHTKTGERLAVIWYADEGLYVAGGCEYESELNRSFSKVLHEDSLYHRNHYDYLTGLPSMTYFFELADAGKKRMLDEGVQPVFLFFDMSGMKYFNRKYGFAEGDELIRQFARVLVRYFSNENCSRFAQDHFAVYTDAEGLEETLQKIFDECKLMNEGKTLPVRVGICLDQQGNVDVSTACDRAKMACDVNRKAYRYGFKYFDDTMLTDANNRQYIIDNLDRAIDEKWIKVYYQPIIRTANGRVSDEEALARWIDPVRGFMSPADFIPLLEDAVLIYKVDLYVLDQILEKMKRQEDAGLNVVPVSLNLSRTDFDVCDMVEEICRRVDAAGIERNKLNIEITESVIGSDFDFMKEQIGRFRERGFRVWMDDFGSGYSSLDVLQSIQFDLIKFDMRFMQQFDHTDKSRIILTELMKMAIGLGIETIAEGVESKDQVDFLREVGCTKLQGFYFCRPIPLEQIIERYENNTQIGFENPAETGYYAAFGRLNLYDPSVFASGAKETPYYFNTLPMAILELKEDDLIMVRCNKSYREFAQKIAGVELRGDGINYRNMPVPPGKVFLDAVKKCIEAGSLSVVDDELSDGAAVHIFMRRVAKNPVTGTVAMAVIVLAVMT